MLSGLLGTVSPTTTYTRSKVDVRSRACRSVATGGLFRPRATHPQPRRYLTNPRKLRPNPPTHRRRRRLYNQRPIQRLQGPPRGAALVQPDGNVSATTKARNYNPRCLKRDLTTAILQRYNSYTSIVSLILGNNNVRDFQMAMQGVPSSGAIGVYGRRHYSIGGDLGRDVYVRPGDPVFWLHHGMIGYANWVWVVIFETCSFCQSSGSLSLSLSGEDVLLQYHTASLDETRSSRPSHSQNSIFLKHLLKALVGTDSMLCFNQKAPLRYPARALAPKPQPTRR